MKQSIELKLLKRRKNLSNKFFLFIILFFKVDDGFTIKVKNKKCIIKIFVIYFLLFYNINI